MNCDKTQSSLPICQEYTNSQSKWFGQMLLIGSNYLIHWHLFAIPYKQKKKIVQNKINATQETKNVQIKIRTPTGKHMSRQETELISEILYRLPSAVDKSILGK